MRKRTFAVTSAMSIDQIEKPAGGGIYFVTAEPAGRVIYIGQSSNFERRGFRQHHKRSNWQQSCGPDERPAIRFATVQPALSRHQLRDVEANLIRGAKPPCNEQHTRGEQLKLHMIEVNNEHR